MLLVVHALLNVVHNLRRTLAAVVIIALGTGLLFLSHAYLQGLYSILSFGIRNQAGDLQIHHADYDHASMTAQPLIPGDVLTRMERILAGDFPEVRTVSRELLFGGLFEAGAQSQGVSGVGLETDRLHRGSASRRVLVAGTDLTYGDDAHTILGEGVAKQVDAEPGGSATVQVYTDSGQERRLEVQVKGVIRTGSSFADAYFIYVPLPFAQRLTGTDGVHRMLLFLRHERQLATVRERLSELIEGHDLPLAVSSWREVQDFYDQLKSFYDVLFTFVIAVVTVLSMVAIFAIISVSFLERLRELGSLRAIGTTRAELLSLLLVEALATYLVGAAAALGLGPAAGTIINALGITFVPIGSNLAVPFYIDLEPRYFLIPAAITLLMTTAAALVPVVRTARMSVAHVLRHE
ncbi:MAG: FtsX-like permease family protein [Spirochaetaceae bacterium]|nr:FtsX-like permease family protein [Spirochaetaceae bacterium]